MNYESTEVYIKYIKLDDVIVVILLMQIFVVSSSTKHVTTTMRSQKWLVSGTVASAFIIIGIIVIYIYTRKRDRKQSNGYHGNTSGRIT